MVAKLKQNFLHLERSGQRFDEHRRTNGAVRHPDVRLRKQENIVPEAGLEIVLHLGKIEVRAEAAGHELLGIVVKVQGKVEEGARNSGDEQNHIVLYAEPLAVGWAVGGAG